MELDLKCQFLTPKIQASLQARLVYLLVEVLPGSVESSLPLNVCLVIDCSDSMHILMVNSQQFKQLAREGHLVEVVTDGVPAWRVNTQDGTGLSKFPRRIDHVNNALRQIAEQIRPGDRYSLVAFAASARTLIPGTHGTQRQRLLQAADQLEHLNLGTETEMADGLALGFREITSNSAPGSTNRLILLTDGYTRNVAACYKWAERAKAEGVTISTLGIGSEFNEDLLIPLADASGGHAYYAEKPEDLPEILRQEFGGALSVSCRSLEIKAQLAANLELRRIHRVLPDTARVDPGPNLGGSYTISLGDLEPHTPPALLLELILPPLKPGVFHPGQIVLSYEDPTHPGSRLILRQELNLQVESAIVEDPQPGVARMVQKVAAYELSTRALTEAATQDRVGATRKLRATATRLLDMNEPSLAGVMLRQADSLEKQGQADASITKRLRYDTRSVAAQGAEGQDAS